MKTFIIKYYLTETAYRSGVPAFTETFRGDRNSAVNWAQNKVRTSSFKFEAGTITSACFICAALRILVSISAIGSVITIDRPPSYQLALVTPGINPL